MKLAALVSVVALSLAAPRAHAQSPAACVFEESDVPFETPLTLFHALPPPGALVEDPFVEVRRSARVRVTLPVGGAESAARVEVETPVLRLRGVAAAARLALYMARPSRFGGVVIPLARRSLTLRQTDVGRALVALPPVSEIRYAVAPEWRACGELRLRAAPPFARAALTPERPRRRIRLAFGDWSIFEAPDASHASRAQVMGPRGEAWLLDARPGGWQRVLWIGRDYAALGWTSARHHVIGLGRGSGTGSGVEVRGPMRRSLRCTRELTLLADDRGTAREIGALRAGAWFETGDPRGPNTAVHVEAPGVVWADGVAIMVPTAQLAGCAPVRP